ncbi:carbon storage regulator [Endozoicomonas sp. SM1973]|uniref:Carbon storage regulator n=1 Tax=Spartinivicinus marinus TaxID=2994442 RepID=A0A853I7C1_9GAMM|nr:carbon storage regulator [Spartinivicinus marinus]MCX4026991.1 carbon storage regulator [Spartinivicinus marinus]NYZ69810.1 carbon storage regulator [Spartinivicinus marinus]
MLTLMRRVGESLKIGDYRLILRARTVGGVTLTTIHRRHISIKEVEFGHPLKLDHEITVYSYPSNRESLSKSMGQAKLSISAPKHMKIERDEVETRFHRNQSYIGVMT